MMELMQVNQCFDGEQRVYAFNSNSLKGQTKFGIFLPHQALTGQACPALFYLAGLTRSQQGIHGILVRVPDFISMRLKRRGLSIIKWKALLPMNFMR